jgi:PadR family transcriptional regulator, regulatory protein AphA
MAKSLTATSHALLGLLSLRPWSTYELAKQVERSLGWFWPRTERKIYDEAKRLVDSGHAEAAKEAVGERERTVYTITPLGRVALRNWLDQPSPPPKLEAEALVRVFFADAGDLEQLRRTLDQLAQGAADNLEKLRDLIAAADDPGYAFVDRLHLNALGLRFQLDYHQMIVDWARWAEEQTRAWATSTDPSGWDWHTAIAAPTPA